MHLPPLIQDLAVILGASTFASLLFQRMRQPKVLGYLLAGIVVGPHTPPFSLVIDIPGIRLWADLGVIFLMFSLGLEFSFKRLRSVGLAALVAGPFEAFFMLGLGFAAGRLLGWTPGDSIFLGATLAISSTTIIIKALEELRLKNEGFAQLIFGVLVVEDLVGIFILVGLSAWGESRGFSAPAMAGSAVRLALIVAAWVVIGLWVIPRMVNFVAKRSNDETVILLALSLCLGSVVLSDRFRYSPALGAFIAGAIVGESVELARIENLVRPIRDVFGAIFFVSIGMLFDPGEAWRNWPIIAVITGLTVFGKIVSTSIGIKMTGRSWRTSLQVGFGLAQIGEFSFVIAGLGVALGVASPLLYSVAVSVSIVTTFLTPYFIRLSGAFLG